jgi:bifunctional DNA-binding transcriptional regulator/antitoxin component of YhaV-PrlF toxin-antitoxin module
MIAFTRCLESGGRLLLPIEIRKILNIDSGDYVEIFIGDNDQLYLAKTDRQINEKIKSYQKNNKR